MSDDGLWGVTLIAFVGSVFSPRYRRRRLRGPADPMDFCALNVVVYGPAGRMWAFTEWPREQVSRGRDRLEIGASTIEWAGDVLEARFDERQVPGGGRIAGRIRLEPTALFGTPRALDDAGRHEWTAIAPVARVEVDMEEPQIRFQGTGYHDANTGSRALEDDFASWTWSRTDLPDGTAVLYDVVPREGERRDLGLVFGADGTVREIGDLDRYSLPRTFWETRRTTRSEPGTRPWVVTTLEDSPFYARSLLSTRLEGHDSRGVHEALSLDRFTNPVVQAMLPFRIRRSS